MADTSERTAGPAVPAVPDRHRPGGPPAITVEDLIGPRRNAINAISATATQTVPSAPPGLRGLPAAPDDRSSVRYQPPEPTAPSWANAAPALSPAPASGSGWPSDPSPAAPPSNAGWPQSDPWTTASAPQGRADEPPMWVTPPSGPVGAALPGSGTLQAPPPAPAPPSAPGAASAGKKGFAGKTTAGKSKGNGASTLAAASDGAGRSSGSKSKKPSFSLPFGRAKAVPRSTHAASPGPSAPEGDASVGPAVAAGAAQSSRRGLASAALPTPGGRSLPGLSLLTRKGSSGTGDSSGAGPSPKAGSSLPGPLGAVPPKVLVGAAIGGVALILAVVAIPRLLGGSAPTVAPSEAASAPTSPFAVTGPPEVRRAEAVGQDITLFPAGSGVVVCNGSFAAPDAQACVSYPDTSTARGSWFGGTTAIIVVPADPGRIRIKGPGVKGAKAGEATAPAGAVVRTYLVVGVSDPASTTFAVPSETGDVPIVLTQAGPA